MAINYSVKADVIDIQASQPQAGDRFFIDTNVLYWLSYSSASSSACPYQIASYPPYIQAAVTTGAELYCSGLSFAELAHLIEKAEQSFSPYKSVRSKEYRHNYPSERTKVVAEVQAAWNLTLGFASQIDCPVNGPIVNAAINRFQTQSLDGYDLLILEAIQHHSIVQVVTDDGDYVTVPGIQVFTANENVIKAAQKQGKLIVR